MGFKESRVRIPPSRPLILKDLDAAGNGGFLLNGHGFGHTSGEGALNHLVPPVVLDEFQRFGT
jgi:hypothetical protein